MAESFEKQLSLADVYATALFRLAQELGRVAEVRDELQELNVLMRTQPGFAEMLSSAALDADRRAASLERMFRGRLSDLVLNALQVLNRHGRADLLAALLQRFVTRQEAAAGQVPVVATTALELDEQQRRSVSEVAAKLAGKQPLMRFRVDPGILGGLVLEIGDWRYDYSVRARLNEARAQLHERSERGLPVGMLA